MGLKCVERIDLWMKNYCCKIQCLLKYKHIIVTVIQRGANYKDFIIALFSEMNIKLANQA